ncbi:MAG: hypothetical protein FJX00_00080 [Alphaproteobacteria bacterium]|nr:hypothetical protein [Alphaproteobacteria bacterium]
MSAYMGTMPWLILWLGIPWIGSGITLLGNPNVLYSRRVLGWSVACFLALSAGLWWINPVLFMTDQVAQGATYDTTRDTIAIGMIFSAIVFLFTWPDGKTAKGLALLGGVLGIMVGVRLGIPQEMYTQWRNVLSPFVFDFLRFVIPFSIGLIVWAMAIPYLTKKNTAAFDQAPLFEKFMYFMRWLLLLLPAIVFIFFDYTVVKKSVLDVLLLLCSASVFFITLQSWRIPGFWRNAGMALGYIFPPLWIIMYFVNRKYTYSPPLTSDKTALCPGALPEQIALWKPCSIMNRSMIWLFFEAVRILSTLTISANALPAPKLFMVFYIKLGIMMMMVLHAYALFQPGFVRDRWLLWLSMFILWVHSFALDEDILEMSLLKEIPTIDEIWREFGFIVHWLSLVIILLPMVKAYKYRAILDPDASTPALSKFWLLCLLGASLFIVWYCPYESV